MKRATLIYLLITLGAVSATVHAHDFKITRANAAFSADGQYSIQLQVDVDALALGVSSTVDSNEVAAALKAMSPIEFEKAVQRAQRTLLRRTRVRFDGAKQRPLVTIPQAGTTDLESFAEPTVLGVIAELKGTVPANAAEFTFGASRAFQAVHLTIQEESTGNALTHVLEIGADSPPYPLGRQSSSPGLRSVAAQYARLGFLHILPKGLDHILFVLGLFLLSPRLRPLLWQVTAFTIAHSVTLALGTTGIVSIPSHLVEPLIALSIAYVAIENICTSDLKPWRPAVVCGFGLLHGLGFAGVLGDLGLPTGHFTLGLVAFNVGVELGQIAVIGAALLTIGLFRHKPWYRHRVIFPTSLLIAIVGVYWFVERII